MKSERGQALILLALAAVGFFAITGLAIDGSAKFSDRRHAQNAADTAAVAAALALARQDTTWQTVALNRARDNGYDNNLVSNWVQVHRPPVSGPYSDCTDLVHFDCMDYVQVTIESHVNTYFARIVGIMQTHNNVEAVASILKERNVGTSIFGGNAVVALSPDGCALMAQGNSNVTINGGGMYSNSDDPSCSFQSASCASVLDVNNTDGSQGAVRTVGGYNAHLGCMPQADVIVGAGQQLPFPPPYQEMAPPAVCSASRTNAPNGNTVTLSPGHYSAMPPRPNIQNTTLLPGVYCIDTDIRANSGDLLKVAGTPGVSPGVFLYVKSGASTFRFNGGATVQLWGINQANVDLDPTLAPYKGFLMYLAPNYATGTPTSCALNGHAADVFTGTIYAPYCSVTIDGSSGSSGFQTQIVGYTVKFAGGANVLLTYSADNNPLSSLTVPLQVGLTR